MKSASRGVSQREAKAGKLSVVELAAPDCTDRRLLDLIQQDCDVRKTAAARLCQNDPLADPLEQPHAKQVLQNGDPPAHTVLGDGHVFGRLGGNCRSVPQLRTPEARRARQELFAWVTLM